DSRTTKRWAALSAAFTSRSCTMRALVCSVVVLAAMPSTVCRAEDSFAFAASIFQALAQRDFAAIESRLGPGVLSRADLEAMRSPLDNRTLPASPSAVQMTNVNVLGMSWGQVDLRYRLFLPGHDQIVAEIRWTNRSGSEPRIDHLSVRREES